MPGTTTNPAINVEMFTPPIPTDADFADPAGRMTLRQLAVIMSTVIEPGDVDVHMVDWAEQVSLLEAGTGHERWQPRYSRPAIIRVFEKIVERGILVLTSSDTPWPHRFDDLKQHAPVVLYVLGNPWRFTDTDIVAMVGARAATGYGEHVASTIAYELVAHDVTVASGGAYGIDGMTHRAVLAAGGSTIVFLAGGVDRFYPQGHQSLFERVVESGQGIVASELPPGSAPTKWRFLQRNRLIAAVSRALIVVEAGARSGSLNAASHANELGRAVGAVPGPITSAASIGCHTLIQSGAECITGTDDVRRLLQRDV